MLDDVPLEVVRLKHHLVLVNLADLALGGGAAEVAAATPQLMATEGGIHGALADVAGFALKEVVFLLRPPGEAIAGLHLRLIVKRLHPQQHVHPQHFIVGEEVLTTRPPQPQVAVEPTPQGGVELNTTAATAHPSRRHRMHARHQISQVRQRRCLKQRLVTVVIAAPTSSDQTP